MRYMLLIYTDNDLWQQEVGEARQGEEMAAYFTYTQDLINRGVMKAGDPLQPVTTATTVRERGDKRLVTDGPFAETREVLGGYYIVDAKDLDEAIELAARCPGARTGSMEVRPIMEMPMDTAPTQAPGQGQQQPAAVGA